MALESKTESKADNWKPIDNLFFHPIKYEGRIFKVPNRKIKKLLKLEEFWPKIISIAKSKGLSRISSLDRVTYECSGCKYVVETDIPNGDDYGSRPT